MAKLGKKNVAESARGRAIIFFLLIIFVVTALLIYIYYKRSQVGVPTGAGLQRAPGIESIPGAGQATTEYVKMQERQNILAAQQAAQQGTAAVPTITRVSYFGPSEFQAPGGPSVPGCGLDDLRRARLAGVTAEELRCKGCSLAQLRAAGYTAGELGNAGYNASDLKNAGFSPDLLRQAGLTAEEARKAGFTPQQLAGAGFNAAQLSNAGFTPDSLRRAGVNAADLAAAGIGVPPSAALPTNCNIDSLRNARARGVTAAQLRKLGCGAAALRAAGYSARDLAAAGYTPEELKAAGFSAKDLKDAGFTPGDLRKAGFSAKDLKDAGFSPADLRAAGYSARDLKDAGFTPNQILGGGYSNGDLVRAGVAPSEIGAPQGPDCSVETLRRLRAQGVSARELKDRGCSAAALLAAGYTPAELKAAGFSDDDLRRAGINPADISAAGTQIANLCSVDNLRRLRAQGVSAAELRNRGCSAAALRAAGYSAGDLKAAGYSDDDLRNAGFSPEEVSAAGGIAGRAVVPSVGTSEMQLAQLQAAQEKQLNEQQKQDRLNALTTLMAAQANTLFGTWAPPSTQQYIEGAKEEREKTTAERVTTTPTVVRPGIIPASPAAIGGIPGVNQGGPCSSIKAGDVAMGVLTSTVNSDENSPVMATIVSGRLRGAKLIGQFSLLKQKVILNFTKLNLNCACKSVGISAVAIDPETAHTALATAVDNHYLLRYGGLFASSFLSGVADAISQSGSQTSATSAGILVTHDKLSVVQSIFVGLGAVGSQYASVLGANFTRPPTVYVCAGTSIGVLFMQDLGDDDIKCFVPTPLICNESPTNAPLCGPGVSACPAVRPCPPVAMPCPVIPR